MRLPDGSWFPWSREFRWDLMPWNRWMRSAHEDHRLRTELVLLAEAVGATIGPVARSAGFVLNVGACGHGHASPGGSVVTILYEADATEFAARYPDHGATRDEGCVDLWIEWFTDIPRVEVRLLDFDGSRHLDHLGRRDLVEIASGPVRTGQDLQLALFAYSDALRQWLTEP